MADRETSQSIDAAAADWAARLDRGPLAASDDAAFKAWLASDRRCPGAMLRANAVSMNSRSAAAFGDGFEPSAFGEPPQPRVSRRGLLTGAVAAGAAGVCAAAFFGLQAPRAYATERGEMRLVPLGDGSTVLLNTQTRVKIRNGRDHRRVELLQGEAYFTVVSDPHRPLVIGVGEARLSTVGGAFRVRRLDDAPVEILVNEGGVSAPGAAGRSLQLGPQTRMALVAGEPKPLRVQADEITRDLAWREGKIAFQGESLGQAARAFSRYSDPRIVIANSALADEPITGLFAANDPVGFSRAAASVFGASITRRGDTVVISAAPI